MNKPAFYGPQQAVTIALPQTKFDVPPPDDGLDSGNDGFQFTFDTPGSDGSNGRNPVAHSHDVPDNGNGFGRELADSGFDTISGLLNGAWSDLFAGATSRIRSTTPDRSDAGGTNDIGETSVVGAGVTSTTSTSTASSTPPGTSVDLTTWVSGSDTPDGYNISVTFMGTWSDDIKQVFKDTLELISDYVIADLPDVGAIDDLHVVAQMADLPGYWGYGGFSGLRSDSFLPSSGYLYLDNAGAEKALSRGQLDDLVFHEVLHCMGFGLTWDYLGLVEDYDGDLRFTGENATEAYASTYKRKSKADALSDFGVPIETDGGAATAGKHWDDATFRNEIMTGRLNYKNKITDMTIGALEDMGYETTYGDDLLVA